MVPQVITVPKDTAFHLHFHFLMALPLAMVVSGEGAGGGSCIGHPMQLQGKLAAHHTACLHLPCSPCPLCSALPLLLFCPLGLPSRLD